MDARVIPFPGGRSHVPTTAVAVGSDVRPAAALDPVGEAFAVVVLGFRPLGEEDATGVSAAALAALEAFADQGAEVSLEGTARHPLVVARFAGPPAATVAAAATLRADHEVRAAAGSRVVVSAAIGEGRAIEVSPGVSRRVGATDLRDLADRAAPGQVLLAGPGWERVPVVVAPAGEQVFVLRGLR